MVFDTKYVESNPSRHYDVSPDGQRFLMIKDSGGRRSERDARQHGRRAHWFEELKARVLTR